MLSLHSQSDAFAHDHYTMRGFILFLLCFVTAGSAIAGVKNIGTPRVIQYPNTVYQGGTQSWCSDIGSNGMAYFANNEGVLEFDGVNWRKYPLPNRTVVRSIYAAEDGKVFAGGYNEFGYFQPDSSGIFRFYELQSLLPEENCDFEDVWSIFPLGNKVVFQSFNQLMILENGLFTVIPAPNTFHFSFLVNDLIYVNDIKSGLYVYDGNALKKLNNIDKLAGKLVWSILPFSDDEILIATDDQGIFHYNGQRLAPWETPVSEILMNSQVYCGTQVSEDEYAFGTILGGVILCSKSGDLIQHLNIEKGLQNNTILSMCLDQYENLWLGLDNGIDYIAINSPLTYLSSFNNHSSGYATVIHKGNIYFGTNQGLFYCKWDALQNSADETVYKLIPETQGQVWALKVIDETLFCGHNSGAYIINGSKATLISDIQGAWDFIQPPGRDDIIIGGTYTGLVKYEKEAGKWKCIGEIPGFDESSRYIFSDAKQKLWVSHGYKGVYHISLSEDYDQVTTFDFYTTGRGFPDDEKLSLNSIDDKPVFTSGNEIYLFEPDVDSFLIHQTLKRKLGFSEISSFVEDKEDNIWFFTPYDMGVFRKKEDGSYTHVAIPFRELHGDFIKWFQSVYAYDDANIFIGTQNGFVHYSSDYERDYTIPFNTFIRKISVLGGYDNIISRGYDNYRSEESVLPFRFRNLQFDYAANDFENQDMIVYYSKLENFDDAWISTGNTASRQFTNLRQGDYIFHVKAINAWGVESSSDTWSFRIKPPWYFSIWAYFGYFVIIMVAVYGFIRYTLSNIRHSQKKFKEEQEREYAAKKRQLQIDTLKAEKEVIRLRNDKLRSEKKQKDMELANTTMQIIQASKALASLKTDLQMLSKELGDHSAVGRVNRILKKVNRNIDTDKQWEVFEKHFTSVHEEFLKRMKEDYPDLSPRELKLCAYLRLNISSKEIANLMNISVRGVEISRYRLRKKLELEHDQNLTDFIIKY